MNSSNIFASVQTDNLTVKGKITATSKLSFDTAKITSDGAGNLTAVSFIGDGSNLTNVTATLGVLTKIDSDTHKITSDGAGNLTAVSYVGDGSALTGVLKPSGTADQFVKGDGSFDSSVFLTNNGLPDISDVAGVVNITGTDLQFGGVSILGGGVGGSFPDITDSSGFIGIGNPNPIYRLDVNGVIGNSAGYEINQLVLCDDSGQLQLSQKNGANYLTIQDNAFIFNIGGICTFQAVGGAGAILNMQDSTPLQLGSSGCLVGVATATPLFALDVAGEVNASGNYNVGGVAGFTGTGAFTNFTIVGGIITAAS